MTTANVHENPREFMMTEYNTMMSCHARMSFPHLLKPHAMKGEPEDKAKYSVTLLIPRQANIKPLKQWIDATVADAFGNKPGQVIKNPILPTEGKKGFDDELSHDFPIMLRCGTAYKPTVYYANGVECNQENEIYGGRWARATLRIFTWTHPLSGKGVSLGLSNLVLLRHDKRLGGGRVSGLDEFKGMFVEGDEEEEGFGPPPEIKPAVGDSLFD